MKLKALAVPMCALAVVGAFFISESVVEPKEIDDRIKITYWEKWSGIEHEAIKAVVEPPAGVEPDVDAIMAFAAERLAKFKLPASIDVTEQLPREAHGKLKKRLLRDPYWATARDGESG